MFQSEIRQSTITELLEKVSNRNYGKFLTRVNLKRVRGFRNKTVTFDFPVTALIGPNGGGKTTILGAAACAYKDIPPRQFFAKSGKLDDSMQNWEISYEVVDRQTNSRETQQRTASFQRERWNRDPLDREVLIFGVARTVPASERAELRKFASSTFEFSDSDAQEIVPAAATAIGRILGKDVSQYRHIRIDSKGRVSLLAGKLTDNTEYSEFHFGAGESSVIRMVMKIEALEKNALVLIEEIENGLHPVATIRMVEYLIDVAERKSAQAIFTTHSNDALEPLPFKGIWAAIDGDVFQGKLSVHSLRAITPRVEKKLVIFTEDAFAKTWTEALLRSAHDIPLALIEVHPMGGDGTAVKVHEHHNMDPSIKSKSLCYIDGDSKQIDAETKLIFRLPGQAPESQVFGAVVEKFAECGGRLAVRLLQPFAATASLETTLTSIRLTNNDPHLLFSQVGQKLGFIPEATVSGAFATTWAEAYPEQVAKLLEPVRKALASLPP